MSKFCNRYPECECKNVCQGSSNSFDNPTMVISRTHLELEIHLREVFVAKHNHNRPTSLAKKSKFNQKRKRR